MNAVARTTIFSTPNETSRDVNAHETRRLRQDLAYAELLRGFEAKGAFGGCVVGWSQNRFGFLLVSAKGVPTQTKRNHTQIAK